MSQTLSKRHFGHGRFGHGHGHVVKKKKIISPFGGVFFIK